MIRPGLDRIRLLLKDIHFPWKAIHVAGTNGKGSICAAASHLLTRRLIKNGRFTSPHLINRWDCIHLNDKPVPPAKFLKVENHFKSINEKQDIGASEFEILTATAFQLFNDHNVRVGVVEVGMGGTYDATNILDNQVVSVISKIAREHQEFLGTHIDEIAAHKAGILRPGVPYIVNPLNEWLVQDTIDNYARKIGAGPRILPDTPQLRDGLFRYQNWTKLAERLVPYQRDNVVLAYLAFVRALQSIGESSKKAPTLLPSLRSKVFPGRTQRVSVPSVIYGQPFHLTVDGAHNPDAAIELGEWVKRRLRNSANRDHGDSAPSEPVVWVLAMTKGKDAHAYLQNIIKPGDIVVTTSFGPVDGMPWVKPMDPEELKRTVLDIHPKMLAIHVPQPGALRALCTAKYMSGGSRRVVVTGSLYLVGDFLREKDMIEQDPASFDIRTIDMEERKRVNEILSPAQSIDIHNAESREHGSGHEEAESQKLLEEINKLNREMEALEVEEARLKRSLPTNVESSLPAISSSPTTVPDSSAHSTRHDASDEEDSYDILSRTNSSKTESAGNDDPNPSQTFLRINPRRPLPALTGLWEIKPDRQNPLPKRSSKYRLRKYVGSGKGQ
ncbi:unnamed protein product [Periconia digitata]|uniref:Folylpolyglutamate synthase n=1 Tax=Periconia digitata TaxID=1303443 RepID=A0A9W4XNS0_9PLEO|nr:unnamed protein product [Periconia digitata]